MMTGKPVSGSFRDSSGSLFSVEGSIYRRVNHSYKDNYDLFMNSGLYKDLACSGMLVAHDEVEIDNPLAVGAYKILKPEMIPFISYPYEWCFSQLRDAALTTLEIQKLALSHGMTLKDCSAYNVQFMNGKPIFIDTLSFENYVEGYPWVAYKQFCQHFLAPLALMSLKDVRFNQLFRVYIDGVPLDLASSVLPFRSRLSFAMQLHIHVHAKSQKYYSDKIIDKSKRPLKVNRQSMLGLIDNLQSAVTGLKWNPKGTEWVDYYDDDSYVSEALDDKQRLVTEYIESVKPKTFWDLGGNTGLHTRIASNAGSQAVCFDIDPACVELNYRQVVKTGEKNILPLLMDLTNPSPSIGWHNSERQSLQERGPVDAVMALALIHHLAISNNVPLARIAEYFSALGSSLIIEFVPKTDKKVQVLLATREDVFPDYTQEGFEREFSRYFKIDRSSRVSQSERVLYLMSKEVACE